MPSISSKVVADVLRVTGDAALGVPDNALPMAKRKAKKPQTISTNPPMSTIPKKISIVVPSSE